MPLDYMALAEDLLQRTEEAVRRIAEIAADTGITLTVPDIVEAVQRALPDDYPAPPEGAAGRDQLITQMAEGILDGSVYEGA